MIENRIKLSILAGLTILLMGLSSLNLTNPSLNQLPTIIDKDSPETPKDAYIHDPYAVNMTGSNVGLKMNASATYSSSVSTWSGALSPFYSPFKVVFPTSMNGKDWSFVSMKTTVSNMYETSNFLPGYNIDEAARKFTSTAWSYPGAQQYSDSYWQPNPMNTITQTYSPSQGSNKDSGTWGISSGEGSADFNPTYTDEVGFISLDASRRSETITPASRLAQGDSPAWKWADGGYSYTNDANASVNRLQYGDGAYGSAADGGLRYYNCNQQTVNGTTYYTSLAGQGGTQVGETWQAYTYGNTQNAKVVNSFTPAYASNYGDFRFTRALYWGGVYTVSTTNSGNNIAAWVRAKNTQIEWFNSSMYYRFFYRKDGGSSPVTSQYTFEIDSTQIGGLDYRWAASGGATVNTASVTSFALVDSYISADAAGVNGGTLIGSKNTVAINDNTFADYLGANRISVPSIDLSSAGTAGKWFYINIEVRMRVTTVVDAFATGTNWQYHTYTATANLPNFEASPAGINIRILNPTYTLQEAVNMGTTTDRDIVISSVPVPESEFGGRVIPAGTPCYLKFGYRPLGLTGINLGNARMIVKFHVTLANDTVQHFERRCDNTIADVLSMPNKYYQYSWYINNPSDPDLWKALNKSKSFYLDIGVRLYNGFELAYSSNPATARIYMSNLNCTWLTVPSASAFGLAIAFDNGGDSISPPDAYPNNGYIFGLIDDANTPTSSVTINRTNFAAGYAEVWNHDADQWFFRNTAKNTLSYTYTIEMVVEFYDWDTIQTLMIFKDNMVWFEFNTTILTPKPRYYSGTWWNYATPGFTKYWQDDFQFFLIIPRYWDSNTKDWAWNGSIGWDMTNPNGYSPRDAQEVLGYVDKNLHYWLEETPPNGTYGSPVNNGHIQVCHMYKEFFWSYINSGSPGNGAGSISWSQKFYAPSDMGSIKISDSTSFSYSDDKIFYKKQAGNERVYVQGQLIRSMDSALPKITAEYRWRTASFVEKTPVTEGVASNLTNAVFDTDSSQAYLLDAGDPIGPNWQAYALIYGSDASGQTGTGQWLTGPYRGGMNWTFFEVRVKSDAIVYGLSNTDLVISAHSTGGNYYTYLFDSTKHLVDVENDPSQMINLSVRWTDYSGAPVVYNPGDTLVTIDITDYWFYNGSGVYVPTYEHYQVPMKYATNGIYWINLDPKPMHYIDEVGTIGNNISRGYHDFTVYFQKTGYDIMNCTGNFSILIDTELTVTSPVHTMTSTSLGGQYYPHWDGTNMLATLPYTIAAEYKINQSVGTTLLSNEPTSPFKDQIYMMYNLTAVYQKQPTWQKLTDPYSTFINEAWFASQPGWGTNPLENLTSHGWPNKGYMKNYLSDGIFRANFTWPAFEDNTYSQSGVFNDYYLQSTGNVYVLEYNITVYMQVKRPWTNEFVHQLHDFEGQISEGIPDSNGESGSYTGLVRVKEETVLLQLNSQTSGNFTKIVPLNAEAIDGDPFNSARGGLYDNDTARIELSSYDPDYRAENYQSMFYPYNAFRIRIALNTSQSNYAGVSEGNGHKAGLWPGDSKGYYCMGPLNQSTNLYAQADGITPYNMSWSSNTSLKILRWNSSEIPLEVEAGSFWSCSVNRSGKTFIAYGQVWVSPWLNWSDKPATNELLSFDIVGVKQGFVISPCTINYRVKPAPTTVLNGSILNPKVETQAFNLSDAYSINRTVAWGLTASFMINYTDITNYALFGKTVNIPDAEIACYEDDDSNKWNNESSSVDVNTWRFTDYHNGKYFVEITFTNVDLGSNPWVEKMFKFHISKTNFTTAAFQVYLNITRREAGFVHLLNKTTDIYYWYPGPAEAATYKLRHPIDGYVTNLSMYFQIVDKSNASTPIEVSIASGSSNILTELWKVSEWYPLGTDYRRVNYVYDGQPNYNLTLANTGFSYNAPGNYTIKVTVQYNDNSLLYRVYAPISFEFNITLIQPTGKIELYSADNLKSYYPMIENHQSVSPRLPSFTVKYTDALRNNTDGVPIQYPIDLMTTKTTNYTNDYRTGPVYGDSWCITGLPNINSKFDTVPIGEYNYIKFTIDIFALPVLSQNGVYQSRYVNITLAKEYYIPVTFTLSYTIINATTKLWTIYHNEDLNYNNTIGEKALDPMYDTVARNQKSVIIDEYRAGSGTVKKIYWGNIWQLLLPYRSNNTEFKDPITPDVITVDGSNPGIGVILIEKNNYPTYSVVELDVSPNVLGEYQYTITVWKANYDPTSIVVTFLVVDHQTYVKAPGSVISIGGQVQYSQSVIWRFQYIDNSTLLRRDVDPTNVSIYLGNNPVPIQNGQEGTYDFGNNLKANISVLVVDEVVYEITINTTGLVVRDQPYFVNLTFSKPFYETVTYIHPNTQDFPTFYITPIDLYAQIWLFKKDVSPGGVDNVPYITILPTEIENDTSVTVWLEVYVFYKSASGKEYKVPVKNNLTFTVKMYDEENRDEETNQPTYIGTFAIEYDTTYGLFKGKVPLSLIRPNEIEERPLAGLNSFIIDINSTNPNYKPTSIRGMVTVIASEGYVPLYIIILGIMSAGSMLALAGYGVRKALLLRIPYVLRMIDESIEKISNDKFPTVGVMLGRNEFVINKVIDFLDMCGIEWAIDDKIEKAEGVDEGEEGDESAGSEKQGPYSQEQLVSELNKISALTPDERQLFLEELKRLDRKGQDEFLKSLKEDSSKKA